ncbi:MAG: hypothetical protein QOH26_1719, partial [Actinomycetota bacterium]|nr:hypothetical protein [Actinomycetota bacterium]
PVVVEKTLGEHDGRNADDLEVVLEVDAWARRRALDLLPTLEPLTGTTKESS